MAIISNIDKYIRKNNRNIYYTIIIFTVTCFISVWPLKYANYFNITNICFVPFIIFLFLLLVGIKENLNKIERGYCETGLYYLLAVVFIGDLLYVSRLAFIGGRIIAHNYMIK